mmetsp:Transcript_3030/g.6179  ORF Transcript_3030/g.6179 Transcript_3030/m.6179 type:complete len:202 (-) Transcript_3030:1484-2089(-)
MFALATRKISGGLDSSSSPPSSSAPGLLSVSSSPLSSPLEEVSQARQLATARSREKSRIAFSASFSGSPFSGNSSLSTTVGRSSTLSLPRFPNLPPFLSTSPPGTSTFSDRHTEDFTNMAEKDTFVFTKREDEDGCGGGRSKNEAAAAPLSALMRDCAGGPVWWTGIKWGHWNIRGNFSSLRREKSVGVVWEFGSGSTFPK